MGSNLLDIVTSNVETTRNKEVNLPKTKKPSRYVAASVFKDLKFVLNQEKKFLKNITNTPIDSILSINDDVQFVFESMKSFNKFGISQLKKLLKVLFDKASTYDEARSTSTKKASKELLTQQLDEAKDRLYNTKAREVKEANQIQSTKKELETIEKKLDNLKERKKNLRHLETTKEKLKSLDLFA
ncbi:hypothetical protein CDL12_20277 [Handroanthus impetiginosus]|uniref:Uncharacterized protein n=1 Tax=Handroanthus impetiginosus TaxID=429701 RepID=A0A2G9GPE2_9LAMI|nr:hypothetical protein CDL12_20277 [Handroanthus impetiginosus]